MSVEDIVVEVRALLATRISRDAVEACIRVRAKGERPLFVRVKPGWYRLA
jgi:hypothetical protein